MLYYVIGAVAVVLGSVVWAARFQKRQQGRNRTSDGADGGATIVTAPSDGSDCGGSDGDGGD